MEMNQNMSEDDKGYVGLINEAIEHIDNIRKIEVLLIINKNLIGLDLPGCTQ